jgi:Transposase Tn5 dimerisation domain/Transposase DNA-binding
MQAWIAMETKDADFGDERLDARYRVLLDQLSDKPSLSIPAACGGYAEAQAGYRFFANEKATPAKVLQPHRNATMERIRAETVVIAAQDTTEVNLTRKKEKVGGPLNDEQHWGLYAHPLLVMTPERVPLGVVHAEMWSRDPEEFAKSSQERRQERRQKPFEEKESYRWLKGFKAACQVAAEAPNTKVVCVSDSEGDIYECLVAGAEDEGPRAEWIVRGCQDRALLEEDQNLLQLLACRAPLGTMTVWVSKREASTGDDRKRRQPRESRKAKVTVRAVRTLLRPPGRPGQKLPPVYTNAILVREEHPPAGEEPIEWLLLTSLPIDTFEDCCTAVGYYCCRWEIEIYFRVLKSGCKIEELQFEHADRMQVCLAMYMIVAWRVLFVLMMGRKCPELSCEAVFAEEEWKSVYVMATRAPVPKTPPTLAVMIPMIAGLGGYLDRKGDGPPGPQTMWIGMQRMRDFAAAWAAFGPAQAKRYVQR